MNAKELRNKSKSELEELSMSKAFELFNIKMQKVTGQLSKPTQLRSVRREIARINTIITEKE